jgi:tetratricopeptide (TPR) repeat protein
MGLSYGDRDAYGGDEVTVAEPLVSAEMLRRHLIALGAIAVVGGPAAGELLAELSSPSPVPPPSRLSGVHVVQVRDLTRRLAEAGRTSGADPEMSSAAAAWASRLLDVPRPDAVRKALMVAVAQLHIQAGWAGFDGCLYDRAMHHYAQALELATEAGDAYCQVLALNWAALATEEHGQPNDALKLLQLAQFKAHDIPSDQGAVVIGEGSGAALKACAAADSATAYHQLKRPEDADRYLAEARELWQPTRTDPYGDLDLVAARLELDRGHLDTAEPFAAASMRRWKDISERPHLLGHHAGNHPRAGW